MTYVITGKNPCHQIYREGEKQFFHHDSFDSQCVNVARQDNNNRLLSNPDRWDERHDKLNINKK